MIKVFLDDYDCAERVKRELSRLLFTRPVFLCIGSDRVTGDCLGPVTGELLASCAPVYGNLVTPVTALNLVAVERQIRLLHPDRQIVAVDSAVGTPSDVGSIRIFSGGLRAGEAMGKNLPEVGDVSVTATVCAKSAKALSCVRLGLVYRLALTLASALKSFCSESSAPSKAVPYMSERRG